MKKQVDASSYTISRDTTNKRLTYTTRWDRILIRREARRDLIYEVEMFFHLKRRHVRN